MLKNLTRLAEIDPNSTRANILWATSQQVIEKAAGYVVIAVLTRTLLQVDLGTMFFCLSIAELTAVILSYGTNNYLIRITAADPDNSLIYLSRVLSTRLVNISIGYVLLNLLIVLIRPEISPVMLLVSGYDFLEEIYYCFSAFFIGRKRLVYRLFLLGGFKILSLFFVSMAAYITRTLFPVLWAYLALDLLLVGVAYWTIRWQFGKITFRFDIQESISLLRQTTPFFLIDLLNMMHVRFDTILVGVLLTLRQVAVYEIGIKLMEVARFLIRPLVNVFLPLFAEYAAQGRWKLFRRRYLLLIGIALGLGILMAIGMQAFGQYVIVLMFSDNYRESVVPSQILFLGIPFLYMTMINMIASTALHLENKQTRIAAVSVALNLGLNFVLIPRFGILGAAWTTVVSQTLEALSGFVLVAGTAFKRRKRSA